MNPTVLKPDEIAGLAAGSRFTLHGLNAKGESTTYGPFILEASTSTRLHLSMPAPCEEQYYLTNEGHDLYKDGREAPILTRCELLFTPANAGSIFQLPLDADLNEILITAAADSHFTESQWSAFFYDRGPLEVTGPKVVLKRFIELVIAKCTKSEKATNEVRLTAMPTEPGEPSGAQYFVAEVPQSAVDRAREELLTNGSIPEDLKDLYTKS